MRQNIRLTVRSLAWICFLSPVETWRHYNFEMKQLIWNPKDALGLPVIVNSVPNLIFSTVTVNGCAFRKLREVVSEP